MKNYLNKVQEPNQTVNPLFKYLGIIIEKISPETVILRLTVRNEFIQGAGIVA